MNLIWKETTMPAFSRDTAPNVQDFGPSEDRGGELDHYTAEFVSIRQAHSLAAMLRGLPGDSCQCPHWGYMLAGRITVTYADREETYQAGDAFYMPPGHVPAAESGTQFLQFSPTSELEVTLAAIQANAAAMQPG
jgi:uncharacterized cupin superfamily protein